MLAAALFRKWSAPHVKHVLESQLAHWAPYVVLHAVQSRSVLPAQAPDSYVPAAQAEAQDVHAAVVLAAAILKK